MSTYRVERQSQGIEQNMSSQNDPAPMPTRKDTVEGWEDRERNPIENIGSK